MVGWGRRRGCLCSCDALSAVSSVRKARAPKSGVEVIAGGIRPANEKSSVDDGAHWAPKGQGDSIPHMQALWWPLGGDVRERGSWMSAKPLSIVVTNQPFQ